VSDTTPTFRPFLAVNPLIPAAGFFLLGVACGRYFALLAPLIFPAAIAAWLIWLLAEHRRRRILAHVALAALLFFSGGALWDINQNRLESFHIARWAPNVSESAAAVRANVLVAPDAAAPHANHYWIAQARQIWTTRGWIAAGGTFIVQSLPGPDLAPGTQVELSGWLSRPPPALNPGAFDPRRQLAADRIFAQCRVPHASGLIVLEAAEGQPNPLAAFRAWLRAKLLAHTIQEDVPAAYALTALLLGYRDPAIADVSQSFADAGVAHLLAISGSHIVFFTALVWAVLRFVPLRPRLRELLIAGIVGLYVLATPCGPPILRAAIALAMVLLARLIGRPRAYFNMLAAAAVCVVILRPMDLRDAGFQLSFVTTAGLILFSPRLHAALFGPWLARLALRAELARTRVARWRQRLARALSGFLVANLIGSVTAAPLVALHFCQVNLWAALAGMAALPIVSLAMVVAAVQLLLELAGAGALLSGFSALVGRAMIWLVDLLAHVPGSAWALRPPPAWLVLVMYALLIVWAMRRRLGVSRATMVNATLGVAVLSAAWYALSTPAGRGQLTVFSAGDGSCMVLRTPRGTLLAIDAGAAQESSVRSQALGPALRLQGARRLDAQLLTALDARHARQAAAVVDACRPGRILVSAPAWAVHEQTLAGAQLARAAKDDAVPVQTLHAGDVLDLGDCRLEIFWPPSIPPGIDRPDLILLCHVQGRRILVVDPGAAAALALLGPMPVDAVILTGPQRGAADAALRRTLTGTSTTEGVPALIWSGRGPWAPRQTAVNEWNTAEGAVTLDITPTALNITRAADYKAEKDHSFGVLGGSNAMRP
jgi:competence protein ComEC